MIITFIVLLFSVQTSTPKRVVLSPDSVVLGLGASYQATVTVYDQSSNPMVYSPVQWLPLPGVMPSCVRVQGGVITGVTVGTCAVMALIVVNGKVIPAEFPIRIVVTPDPLNYDFKRFDIPPFGRPIAETDDLLASIGEQGYGTCYVVTLAKYFHCFRPKTWTVKYRFQKWPWVNGQPQRDALNDTVASEGFSSPFVWAGQLRASKPKP